MTADAIRKYLEEASDGLARANLDFIMLLRTSIQRKELEAHEARYYLKRAGFSEARARELIP